MALAFDPRTPPLEMLRHRVPVEVGPGWYLVTGRDGITEYTVLLDDDGSIRCNCRAGRFGRVCWHKTCVLLRSVGEAAVGRVVALDEQLADLMRGGPPLRAGLAGEGGLR